MQSRRVTMKDVASKAGVHQTTVSLALRNHPSLPQKTINRIKEVAKEMGYTPDPMLSSLVSYRRTTRANLDTPTIGYIMDLDDQSKLEESQPRTLFLKSAKKRAEELGYKIEVFYYSPERYPNNSLERILHTRNINALILGAFWYSNTSLELSWERYSVIKIEMLPFNLKFDVVENNQMQATRLAMEKAHEMGIRRVGMFVGRHDEDHTRNLFSAGYYVGQQSFDEVDRIPLLVIEGKDIESDRETIIDWAEKHEVDAVITNWPEHRETISKAGEVIGREVRLIPLDIDHYDELAFGVMQNHEDVGRCAVERVASLMRINRRGMMDNPTTHLIDSFWRAGAAVPPEYRNH